LRVWQESIELYKIVSRVFRIFPFTLAKVASQNIASADSVHRNIAEGYCRRSVKEYLQSLYVALGSLGETVSGSTACRAAEQISPGDFEQIDLIAFKLENDLLKLVESLERKRDSRDWIDSLVVRESNSVYSAGDGDDSPWSDGAMEQAE